MADNVCHRFTNAQFGISHIKKIGTADELPERFPTLDVSLVIRGVAIAELEMDGNCPVRSDIQNPALVPD